MPRRNALVSCALFALVACTVNTNPGPAGPQPGNATPTTPATPATPETPETPPPGAEGGESANTPVGTPETPPLPGGVVVAPRPTPDKQPVDRPPAGATVECTPETRKGGMCTREYRPVCGSYADKTTKTFSNPCGACSDEKITGYVQGACATK